MQASLRTAVSGRCVDSKCISLFILRERKAESQRLGGFNEDTQLAGGQAKIWDPGVMEDPEKKLGGARRPSTGEAVMSNRTF